MDLKMKKREVNHAEVLYHSQVCVPPPGCLFACWPIKDMKPYYLYDCDFILKLLTFVVGVRSLGLYEEVGLHPAVGGDQN